MGACADLIAHFTASGQEPLSTIGLTWNQIDALVWQDDEAACAEFLGIARALDDPGPIGPPDVQDDGDGGGGNNGSAPPGSDDEPGKSNGGMLILAVIILILVN